MTQPNAQYNLARPNSLPVQVALYARRQMYRRFLELTRIYPSDSILDVGVTSDQSYESSNYLEAWYPHKHLITAVGLDDASFLEYRYPGITFQRADGRELPFADECFDIAHSSAVLEHVGSEENQAKFVQELVRVARKSIFLTTPNRWFPIEFHSLLPLVHWLPKRVFRRFLKNTRYDFFSREENLNLLSKRDLEKLCARITDHPVAISTVSLLGIPSNILVTISKL
jgi:ubiquinone/menaquinone biosynthesis C-methylase UbiE